MAKQKKRDKCVVVNEIYFRMIERKAYLLDEIATDFNGEHGSVVVGPSTLKDIGKLYKEWDKQDVDDLGGSEPYTEPKD